MKKKRLISCIAAIGAALGVGFGGALTAQAAVAPIWCGTPGLCQLGYVEDYNYWMARRNYDGEPWIRLTLVAGWNNTQVAPITCETRTACVVQYYDPYQATGYWMARRANGTVWVRLTSV